MAIAYYASPIGWLRIVCDKDALVEISPMEEDYSSTPVPDDSVIREAMGWLDAYFAGTLLPTPLLAPKGTAFQQRVWAELLKIPYGEVATYGEIAQRMGAPKACRAVGGAVGKNPLLIMIPCHRVVAANGIGGFSCKIERKKWLMAHENVL